MLQALKGEVTLSSWPPPTLWEKLVLSVNLYVLWSGKKQGFISYTLRAYENLIIALISLLIHILLQSLVCKTRIKYLLGAVVEVVLLVFLLCLRNTKIFIILRWTQN